MIWMLDGVGGLLIFEIQLDSSDQDNMEDDTVALFFKHITDTPNRLLEGHRLLSNKLQQDPQFAVACLEYLANAEDKIRLNENNYFTIVTLLHPVLVEEFTALPSEVQDQVRSGLLSSVVAVHPSLRTVGALGLLIREVLQIDSLEPWLQPLGELLKWVASDDLGAMQAGIEFFVYLLKQTNYNRGNSQLALHKLAPVLLQNFFQIFAHPQLSQWDRQKLMYLVLQVIKSFSMLDGIDDEVVSECFEGTFELWMSLFISALQGSINLNIGIKKYIIKILIVIFRDMQRYLLQRKYHQPTHLYVIWEFAYKALPLYLWAHVWERNISEYPLSSKTTDHAVANTPYYDDDADALCSPLEALALAVLQFLSVLTSVPHLQNTLRLSVHHLTNGLFHYMLLSEGDLAGWKTNNQHFILQGGNMDYQLTIRNKCLGILNEMIEKFGDFAIQAILVASEKFLLNLGEETTTKTLMMIAASLTDLTGIKEVTSNIYESQAKFTSLVKLSSVDVKESLKVSGESWRKVEVALLVLGRFSEDIIVFQSKQSGAFDIQSFVKGIVRQIGEEDYYSLLKGQSLYCLTRFTEIISIKYRSLFGELAVAAAGCNQQNYPIPVRLIACKALSIFLKKMDKHKLELSSEQLANIENLQPIDRVVELPLLSETLPLIMELLVELNKHKQLTTLLNRPAPEYFLGLFHQCINQSSLLTTFIGLLEGVSQDYNTFSGLVTIFLSFSSECLKAYSGVLHSEQKKYLKGADTELILTALRVSGLFIQQINCHSQSVAERERMVELLPTIVEIMELSEEVQLQVALSLYLKGVIRIASEVIVGRKELVECVVSAVRILLLIPKDKSLQSGSIYAGNLIILLFDKLLKRNHNEILQEIVLKVFRSRTPSVIQSLVLVYSRLINQGTTKDNKFKLSELQANIRGVVDFLSSFSIQNRMGLKILIDKWLLQQSLFRGKYTKVATFMALSKLFLLSDKRVDNLLVIGFNPSHTNVNNDVNAPLKILATLIRCLDNELAGSKNRDQQDDDAENQQLQIKEEGLEVNLEKFKDEEKPDEEVRGGGLADRENQQGSTCYMSAMLEFYDDGEECDDKTQEDLLYLKDTSTNFTLSQYLTDFFQFLAAERTEYLRECLKGLLRKDQVTLQKYIKLG